jgi:hypothetical protein
VVLREDYRVGVGRETVRLWLRSAGLVWRRSMAYRSPRGWKSGLRRRERFVVSRTPSAVAQKRSVLGIAAARGRGRPKVVSDPRQAVRMNGRTAPEASPA